MTGAVAGRQSYLGASTSSNISRNPMARAVRRTGPSCPTLPLRAQISERSGISVEDPGDWASRPVGRYAVTTSSKAATAAVSHAPRREDAFKMAFPEKQKLRHLSLRRFALIDRLQVPVKRSYIRRGRRTQALWSTMCVVARRDRYLAKTSLAKCRRRKSTCRRSPIPPTPIWAVISYGPRRVPGVRAIRVGPDYVRNR